MIRYIIVGIERPTTIEMVVQRLALGQGLFQDYRAVPLKKPSCRPSWDLVAYASEIGGDRFLAIYSELRREFPLAVFYRASKNQVDAFERDDSLSGRRSWIVPNQ